MYDFLFLFLLIFGFRLHYNYIFPQSSFKYPSTLLIKSFLRYFLGFLTILLLGILAQTCHLDYGFFGVAIIFLFHLFRNNKITMIVSFILACILKFGIPCLENFNLWYIGLTIFTILPIIFICLYNKKQGPKVKYLLYLFYPVHLLILYFLFK